MRSRLDLIQPPRRGWALLAATTAVALLPSLASAAGLNNLLTIYPGGATQAQAQEHIEEQVEWFTDQFYDGLTPEEAAKEALA